VLEPGADTAHSLEAKIVHTSKVSTPANHIVNV